MNIVGEFGENSVLNSGDFITSRQNFPSGGTVRRAGRCQRWHQAPSGEWKRRNFPRGVGLAAAAVGFGLLAEQSRGRLMLRTYAVSEAAESCGGGIDLAEGSTDLVVR